jgi:hypothetical protein
MKKMHSYEIDMTKNVVVVTKKFFEESTQLNTDEFKLLHQFRDLGLAIVVETRKPRTKKQKKEDGKKPLLTYKMMRAYIAALDVADELMDDFDAICESAKARGDRLAYINKWFHEQCPNYYNVPTFNDDHKVVLDPNKAAA